MISIPQKLVKISGGRQVRQEVFKSDITVVGGGLAGIAAAISAARLGEKVSLIQNRPVLGGNSSSEVRVWVCSATKHGVNRYARETGIMGELFVENQYRNQDGNPYIWDALLLEKILAEKNIQLFLNTDVTEVKMSKEDKISSVVGWMQGSERRITFESKIFIDCTGDGLIGALADVDYALGRESQKMYGESLAPLNADDELLGSTLLFYTKDAGYPVDYYPPSFAKDIFQTPIPENRIISSGDSGTRYWWIEWGGEIDIVHDNEIIRDELMSVIFGIWDYIKNSGKFDARNLTLEWVGSVPGKREYRRFIGEYVLKQQDIENQTLFADRIGFGGWSIDLHPPKGMYTENAGARHSVADGVYHIPYRTLYSQKVNNLLFAGRNVSASHIAFGSIRIMATCAVMGEAAGTAAAFALKKNITPHQIYTDYLQEYQQLLLRQDGSVLGVTNEDPHDIARQATIKATHYLDKVNTFTKQAENYNLTTSVAFTAPVDPSLENLELLIDCKETTILEIELWETGKPQNYIPAELIKRVKVNVYPGMKQWVSIPFDWKPIEAQNAFIIVKENPAVSLYLGYEPFIGILSYVYDVINEMKQPDLHKYERESPVLYWTNQKINRRNFIFRFSNPTLAYDSNKLLNGYVRPYGGPNMWVASVTNNEEILEYSWSEKQIIQQFQITFNDDVHEDLINLPHHYTNFQVIPEIVKSFRIDAWINGDWEEIIMEHTNRKRHFRYNLPSDIETEKIRFVIFETNGSHQFSINEIRIY